MRPLLSRITSRSRGASWLWSQKSVIGTPLTNSITKYGRPVGVAAVVDTGTVAAWDLAGVYPPDRHCPSRFPEAR